MTATKKTMKKTSRMKRGAKMSGYRTATLGRIKSKIAGRSGRRFESLMSVYPPRPVTNQHDYRQTMKVIEALLAIPRPTKAQREYLETLSVLAEDFERRHHAIDTSSITPADALRALCEDHGVSGSDLGRLLGNRTLGHALLKGERELSKANIAALCDHFRVSADLFIRRRT